MRERLNWLPVGVGDCGSNVAFRVLATRGASHASRAENGAGGQAAPAGRDLDVDDGNLDREGVILAALRAMTDAALGHDDAASQADSRGRNSPFASASAARARPIPTAAWPYDAEQKVLRVKVQSNLTGEALPASDLLRHGYEGAVGFTLGRPWLLAAGCPVARRSAACQRASRRSSSRNFSPTANSRVQRPQRAYELTKPLEPDRASRSAGSTCSSPAGWRSCPTAGRSIARRKTGRAGVHRVGADRPRRDRRSVVGRHPRRMGERRRRSVERLQSGAAR